MNRILEAFKAIADPSRLRLMALCARIEEAAPWAHRRPALFGRGARI